MRIAGSVSFTLPALLLVVATAGAGPGLDETVAIERDTERLAYRLIDLSEALRRGDDAAARGVFADAVVVRGFPPAAGTAESLGHGVARIPATPGAGEQRSAAAAVAALRSLLAPAADVEAVMIKPTDSHRVGERLEAEAKLRAVLHTGAGGRVWVRGKLHLLAAGGDAPAVESLQLATLERITAPRSLFTEVSTAAGIACDDPGVLEHPTLGLAAYGAAAGDVDGDGRLDLFVTAHDGNRLLLGRAGGRFETVAVASPRVATAPLLLDYDNDGDLDVFLSANGPQMLLENRRIPDGALAFRDVSERMGVAVATIGFSIAAADVNGDRQPDLYVAAYNNYGPVAPDSWVDGRNGLPNLFFVSRPDGTYEEAAARWGVADSRWSYGAQWIDADEDGKADLYVANDFGGGNALFMRRGDRFVDEAKERGVRDDGYAMGVSCGDYDNDGRLDLHVTRMSSTAGRRILGRLDATQVPALKTLLHLSAGNGLYRNVGDGRYEDVTDRAGPFPSGWAWGGGFLDIDNDGYEDLFTPNGHLSGAAIKDT